MTEIEFFEQLKRRWPHDRASPEPTCATIELADAAVRAWPLSAQLWTARGDLLQLADTDCGYPLREVERCYRHAIKADPLYAEAYEELGRFLAASMDNRRKAKRFLDKARRLRRSRRCGQNDRFSATNQRS